MIESREASSPVCVRSVAAALRDEFIDVYGVPPWQRRALALLSPLGGDFMRRLIPLAQKLAGVAPRLAATVDVEDLARSHVAIYANVADTRTSQARDDAIFVGAPNGGVAHLANLVGAPFLSQHFVISFREQCHPDDIGTYFMQGTALARAILDRNPELAVVNHYDPLHDRWLVGSVNHIRLKALSLPEAYRRFIRERLKPGGTIVFVCCDMPWLQYDVGPRHTFQVGGLGGVSDRGYIESRPELISMQQAARSPYVGGWRLNLPLAEQPESEWGALPQLGESVEGFARQHGYRVARLEGPHPEWFSSLAFRAWSELYRREGRPAQGVLAEMFTNVQPAAVRRSRLLPLWLPWNCVDSLDFLLRMRPRFPAGVPVLFLLLSNFSLTFDTVPWRGWLDALRGLDLRILGQRERLFPSDPVGLWAGGEELEAWCARHPDPVSGRMSLEELLELA